MEVPGKMLMTDSCLPGSYITYAALTLGNVILLPLPPPISPLSGGESGHGREGPEQEEREE